MAIVYPKMYQQQNDPETGCSASTREALELCRQNYFMKQQNQILQSQQSNPKPEENAQLKAETQIQAEEVNDAQKEGITVSPVIIYVSFLIVVIIATVFITKYLIKK